MRTAGAIVLGLLALLLAAWGISIMVAAGPDVPIQGRVGTGALFLVCAAAVGGASWVTFGPRRR